MNRERLKRAGASAIVRPLRGYPEMIIRAIVAPGTEWIIERLFSSEGDECLRFDVMVRGLIWSKIVTAVLEANFGTPVGYADARGQPHSNPPPRSAVSAEALFILVDETQKPTVPTLQKLLDSLPASQRTRSRRRLCRSGGTSCALVSASAA